MKVEYKSVDFTFDDLVNMIDLIFIGSDWLLMKYKKSELSLISDEYKDSNIFSEKAASILCNGGSLVCINTYEIEDADDKDEVKENTYFITKEKLEKAAIKLAEDYPHIFEDIINENDDYYTWDNLFQMAMFDEIVYG